MTVSCSVATGLMSSKRSRTVRPSRGMVARKMLSASCTIPLRYSACATARWASSRPGSERSARKAAREAPSRSPCSTSSGASASQVSVLPESSRAAVANCSTARSSERAVEVLEPVPPPDETQALVPGRVPGLDPRHPLEALARALQDTRTSSRPGPARARRWRSRDRGAWPAPARAPPGGASPRCCARASRASAGRAPRPARGRARARRLGGGARDPGAAERQQEEQRGPFQGRGHRPGRPAVSPRRAGAGQCRSRLRRTCGRGPGVRCMARWSPSIRSSARDARGDARRAGCARAGGVRPRAPRGERPHPPRRLRRAPLRAAPARRRDPRGGGGRDARRRRLRRRSRRSATPRCPSSTRRSRALPGGLADRAPAARLWRPAPFLEEVLPLISRPRGTAPGSGARAGAPPLALDLACGAGRDAVFLAQHGFEVEGWDHAPEALERAHDLARRHGVTLRTELRDLERPGLPPPARPLDLIVCFRFLHRPLFPWMERALAPGGWLVYETYRAGQERFGRPIRRALPPRPRRAGARLPRARDHPLRGARARGGPGDRAPAGAQTGGSRHP